MKVLSPLNSLPVSIRLFISPCLRTITSAVSLVCSEINIKTEIKIFSWPRARGAERFSELRKAIKYSGKHIADLPNFKYLNLYDWFEWYTRMDSLYKTYLFQDDQSNNFFWCLVHNSSAWNWKGCLPKKCLSLIIRHFASTT